MPSYYDSAKKKPGKATLKYNEGGKLKKIRSFQLPRPLKGGGKGKTATVRAEELSSGPASQMFEEIIITAKKGPQRGKGAGSGKSGGGSRGRTIARGSGAARPQRFGRNG